MKNQTIKKISSMLEDVSEKKAGTLIEFIDFLRWSEDKFTAEEDQIIIAGSREAKEGEGVNWRDVRADV